MSETLLEKFQQAYRDLDLFPLIKSEDIDKFRVDYGHSVRIRLQLEIGAAASNEKIVFAGHRGCGKSTLLKQLSVDMQPSHAVIFFSISDQIEMSAITHTNILYAIAIRLLSYASKQKIPVEKDIQETLLSWNDTVRKQITTDSTKGSTGIGGKWFEIVSIMLQQEQTFREDLEKTFSKKIADLVRKCDRIAATIQLTKKQPVLVIIDDLDKLDLSKVPSIFRDNVKSLFSPGFRILFTIPIAAAQEPEILGALNSVGIVRPRLFPVAKFFSKADRHNPEAQPDAKQMATFIDLLDRRIPAELIEPDTARKIVLKSGGLVREIVRLARECCLECMVQLDSDAEVVINDEILTVALDTLRTDFERQIGSALYELLTIIYETANPPDTSSPDFVKLLNGLMVLEYKNSSLWFDVHPIVMDLMRQKGLIEAEG